MLIKRIALLTFASLIHLHILPNLPYWQNFETLVRATLLYPDTKNNLRDTFNSILDDNELGCKQKAFVFSILMIYRDFPVITDVINQSKKTHKEKFAYLATIYEHQNNLDLIVPFNECRN